MIMEYNDILLRGILSLKWNKILEVGLSVGPNFRFIVQLSGIVVYIKQDAYLLHYLTYYKDVYICLIIML